MRRASPPSRGRGSKLARTDKLVERDLVAPLAGAWIETPARPSMILRPTVAPLAGAWIETRTRCSRGRWSRVAPLAGAWIETERA